MVKPNWLGKVGHILCILGTFWATNDHSKAGTSQMNSELIFMFLESGEQGEWAQIGCQFKIQIFIFLPPPNGRFVKDKILYFIFQT